MSIQPGKIQSETWLATNAIATAITRQDEPEISVIQDILAKSLAMEPLGLDEIVALLRCRSPESRDLVLASANQVKLKAYGDRIVLTAPLHINNHCQSQCLYCSAHIGNGEVRRKKLDLAEVREAGKKLIRQGHKRIILTAGQADEIAITYYCEAIEALFRLFEGSGEIRRININAGALTSDECSELTQTEVGAALIYQETYHRDSYRAAHPKGPKSNYEQRLQAPDIALENGFKDVGLGLCLGLGPWDFDLLALSLHAAHLAREYGIGSRDVNLHRMRAAPGCAYKAPHALNDEEFLYCVAITRLALPYTGIILTTREPSGIWRNGCDVGASQLITGSLANPYESWVDAPGEKVPFPVGEETHLDEVVRFLLESAHHLPSFCSACPRLGRSGGEFISMVSQGEIKSQCGPNSIASFLEFLLNYATPYTRQIGEKLIHEKLEDMDAHERGSSEKLLQKVRSGRLDEFI